MGKFKVRVVELEPMRVASAHGYGQSPEEIAWDKILAYAERTGIEVGQQRFFGFDNPNPSPGSPNYGYEQWMTVGPEFEGDDDIEIKAFAGGLYGVTRFKGLENIGRVWKQLVVWREDSKYQPSYRPCLEELLSPPGLPFEEMVFDLWIDIAD